MKNSITDVPGILVGHAQDDRAGTGCTVILCGDGILASADVRGGAPGTIETDCLDPSSFVSCVHAVYLGGGSAFGLDGASGVMRWLEDRKTGFDVGVCRIPIVPGAVLYDLLVGDPLVRPDAAMGARACQAAGAAVAQGNVGAGTGATVGKAGGIARAMKGGLGTASLSAKDLVVAALVVVNCYGDVVDPATGQIVAGALNEKRDGFAGSLRLIAENPAGTNPFTGNTTIGVVATNARLDKAQAKRVAMMAHDGFARTINPIHTAHDGDAAFCLATGAIEADVTVIGSLAADVVSRAILNGVRSAVSAYGVPGYDEMRERMEKGRR
jgi:L-aminopeptidase/D-esterase-like protein